MKVLVSMAALFISPYVVLGQPDHDTSYIKSYRDKLVVTVLTATESNSLELSSVRANKNLNFETNSHAQIGLGLDYKWFTLEGTVSLSNTGDPQRGVTDSWGLGFGLTSRKWWFRNFFKGYQGFYLANPEDWVTDWQDGDPYPYAPDLRTRTYYAEWNYTFNYMKYSNMASLWQLEKQLKSAGTWNIGLTFAMSSIDNTGGSLIPQEFRGTLGPLDSIKSLSLLSVGMNFGYLYNWAISKNWFLSAGLVPGLALQAGYTVNLDDKQVSYRNNFAGTLHSRFIGGYNGDRWYGGVRVYSHAFSTDSHDEYPIDLSYVNVRLYVGYRFDFNHNVDFLKKIGL